MILGGPSRRLVLGRRILIVSICRCVNRRRLILGCLTRPRLVKRPRQRRGILLFLLQLPHCNSIVMS